MRAGEDKLKAIAAAMIVAGNLIEGARALARFVDFHFYYDVIEAHNDRLADEFYNMIYERGGD